MALSLGTNGVRATFNKLNPQAAADFAFAFSRSISKKRSSMPTIAIARDMRKTSPCLMQAAASAIMEGGANALDIGLLPSPVAEWASMHFKCAGLIIITASHNPPEYNALKFVDGRGVAISRERGASYSKFLGKTHSPSLPWQSVGKLIKQENVLQEYERAVLDAVPKSSITRKLKIVADPGNGTATIIAPALMEKFGAKVITINEKLDGTFPSRPSEPAEKNVSALIKKVKEEKADFGVAWDGDADRVIFVDENGQWLNGDKCVAISALHALKEAQSAKGKFVVTTAATSMAVEAAAVSFGAKIKYTDVGAPYLAEEMQKLGDAAVCGGEEVGGIIWPEFSLAKDGIFAVCKLMQMASIKPISKWVEELPKYYNAKTKISAGAKEKAKVISSLQKKILAEIKAGAKSQAGKAERREKAGKGGANEKMKLISLIGGLRISFENSWVLVRASGTEEYIRIFAESPSQKEAQGLMNKYKSMAKQFIA
ncbi:hypothetical protein COU37_04070 [Candidatus Micrarchaeota archaeon CG10_big_fil_rev_8_21_14_0_10_45_29]|nr:MAG: hypothetical protein COU37_04070 [Candidatus Micrarchaeota archaeon CG10_big_fil_rev_8_21_14_0_10_45_29]